MYNFPILHSTQYVPDKVISFNERNSVKNPEEYWIDFFIDDYQFECLWNNGIKYINVLKKFKGVITPDYSMYPEFSKSQNIWNCYRNRVMAYYLQRNGIRIIPVASWCFEEDFDWCLDGLSENASIAISNNGCLSNIVSKEIFLMGVEELQKRKHPSHLIICGRKMKELEKYKNIVYYPSFSMRMQERIKNGR